MKILSKIFKGITRDPLLILCDYCSIMLHLICIVGVIMFIKFSIEFLIF